MRPSLIMVVFLSWGVLFFQQGHSVEPSGADLLAAFEKQVKIPTRLHYFAESQTRFSGLSEPGNPIRQKGTLELWRDGIKTRIALLSEVTPPGPNQQTTSQYNDFLYPEKGSLTIFRDGVKKKVDGVVAYLGPVPPLNRLTVAGRESGPIHGYLKGWFLPDLLRETTLTARKDRLGDKECWVLEGKGKWGLVSVWLDPVRDWLPVRFSQMKTADDWYSEGKPLKSITGRPPWRPKSVYRGEEIVVDFHWQAEPSTPAIPKSLVKRWTELFANGQKVVFETTVSFPVFELQPDFDTRDPFRMGDDIPNGTPVQVDDHPNIKYEWQDGKIVKSIDKTVVADMASSTFSLAPWYASLPWQVGGLTLVGITLAIGFWLWSRKRRPTQP